MCEEYDSKENIYKITLNLLQSVSRYSNSFLKWCNLSQKNKRLFCEIVEEHMSQDEKYIYHPLQEALIYWENIQDVEGAPGLNLEGHKWSKELEENIKSVFELFTLKIDKFSHLIGTKKGKRQLYKDPGFITELGSDISSLDSALSVKDDTLPTDQDMNNPNTILETLYSNYDHFEDN